MISDYKSANVSYSENALCKSLAIPAVDTTYTFGTGMTDPVWKQAATATDFVRFHDDAGRLPTHKSTMAWFRNDRHLILGVFFNDPPQERTHLPENATSMWQADLFELHFAGMDPDPWLMQLCIGIDGSRFDSTGSYDHWEAAIFANEDGWGAEVRMDLGLFRLTEGGMRFNMARDILQRKEHVVWSPLMNQYHEVPNFGELLFASYDQVASLRTGRLFPASMTRQQFEEARSRWELPATKITHGPFLSNPDKGTVCVTWQTAGRVPAYLTYREKGTEGTPIRVNCSEKGGVLSYDTLHFVQLKGLRPDTEYTYELFSLSPVAGRALSNGAPRAFRTTPAETNAEFSFFCFTDLHSDAEFLRRALAMPQAKQAAFQASLGDNLSYASGIDGIYNGYIDPIVQAASAASRDTPLVFVRGNHEELGVYASDYFRVLAHPTGRSWYTFTIAGCFFIVLDSGDDKEDAPTRPTFVNSAMYAAEQAFLKDVLRSPEYLHASRRIVFMHIPPLTPGGCQWRLIEALKNAAVHPDIMLCGHEHRYIWQEAAPNGGLPFPVLVCSCHQVLSCEVTDRALKIKLWEPQDGGNAELATAIDLP